jgi:uncharacterized membrane protein YtjA (UPF0391 family)
MLRWALIFAVAALILWVLGFTGAASFLGGIAEILLWIFVILFVVFLILHLARGRTI